MDSSRAPGDLRKQHADWEWSVHWESAPAVTTFRLAHADGRVRFLKLGGRAAFPRVRDEAERMRWAAHHLPVPEVIEAGSTGEVDWLLTEASRGIDATDDGLRSQPERLVSLLAEGLRRFHEAPFADCPFDFRLDRALALARDRVEAGLVKPEHLHEDYSHLTIEQGLAELEADPPPEDELVVCHGDYCFPNVLIDDWAVSVFVDLGELGVADRWWDLAVGSWTTVWNLGSGWEEPFIHAYGVEPDWRRIHYYRLLYDYVS